jgi:hypothetical protein
VWQFIMLVDELFRSLFTEIRALPYQASYHNHFVLAIYFKFDVAEILFRRWKQTTIARRRIPLI